MSIQEYLQTNDLDAIVVTNLLNIRHLTGFSGSNALLLATRARTIVITDFRYQEQIKRELKLEAEVVIAQVGLDTIISESLQDCKCIAFEGNYLTANQYDRYRALLIGKELKLVDIDSLRLLKNAQEIAATKQAADIANQAFSKLLTEIKVGMSEQQVAALLDYYTRSMGAEKMAFDTIVASGLHSAMPHAKPTSKPLNSGDLVTIDFGAVYAGYHSDMTRSFVMGCATDKQREVYNTVLQAQLAALSLVQVGVACSAVDKAARDIITTAGYGEFFGHATGHGTGLQIHEEPRLSSASQQLLQAGMLVTVEPGIYIPGFGGVRIEDLVAVTPHGQDVLTAQIDKQLLEIH